MSLPTLDAELQQRSFKVGPHLLRSALTAGLMTVSAIGFASKPAFGHLLQLLQIVTSSVPASFGASFGVDDVVGGLAPIDARDPMRSIQFLLAWIGLPAIFAFLGLRNDDNIDGQLDRTLALFLATMHELREHARERILHNNLKQSDADEICAVLEQHLRITNANRYKLLVRKFSLAFWSFLPWLVAFIVLLVASVAYLAYGRIDDLGWVATACLGAAYVALSKGRRAWNFYDRRAIRYVFYLGTAT